MQVPKWKGLRAILVNSSHRNGFEFTESFSFWVNLGLRYSTNKEIKKDSDSQLGFEHLLYIGTSRGQ